MMKVGILQADAVSEEFQDRHGDYPQMFDDLLVAAAAELEVTLSCVTYDVEHGEYPERPEDCDGYVITGSRKSVYDAEPWIADLRNYVRTLYQSGSRLVGICFGHQLVAEAFGGRTQRAEVGWGVGNHDSQVVEKAWFMEPPLERFSLLVSHQDQVSIMPGEATLLASSDFCPVSMYTIEDRILAMQGHPEFAPAYSADLMNMRREVISEETYQRGIASLQRPISEKVVGIWIVRFLKGQ